MDQYIHQEISNSLYHVNPAVSRLWHPTKNGTLTPKQFSPGSGAVVWWRCEKGHEWQSRIVKLNKGNRCPYCSNKKVGEHNNLAVLHPKIASEWHPTKNKDLTPYDVVPGSAKKVWWKCQKGHEWQTSVQKRAIRGQRCANCTGRGRRTRTIQDVKEIFSKENCVLLEDVYVNGTTKMKYQCSCGNISEIDLAHFKRGRRCKHCQHERGMQTRKQNQSS